MMRKEIYKAITEQTLIAQLTKSFVLSKKKKKKRMLISYGWPVCILLGIREE